MRISRSILDSPQSTSLPVILQPASHGMSPAWAAFTKALDCSPGSTSTAHFSDTGTPTNLRVVLAGFLGMHMHALPGNIRSRNLPLLVRWATCCDFPSVTTTENLLVRRTTLYRRRRSSPCTVGCGFWPCGLFSTAPARSPANLCATAPSPSAPAGGRWNAPARRIPNGRVLRA